MARSKETFFKKEVRNKKEKKRKEKVQRKLDKKEKGKQDFDDMIAWVDENGVITSTPPDLTNKKEVKAENIEISIPKSDERVNNKLRTGKVNNFDDSKGFGFIIDSDTRDSIFVHINDCNDDIAVGDKVEFELEKGPKGLKASNVNRV
ncbi:cold-shock protein [Marinigracilibium pacificum]|uniref:Cold shock domain-containing protein n=1 Tax=Marinigracilibium pacificum TaxID=2729599 RepID=A0A848IU11_9BACT|nr:cold shock domain-containing protein [Marinigracilibium pacificum]NMM47827.1 cold shock domain-containing protein [Marinigracilibium pacificum]